MACWEDRVLVDKKIVQLSKVANNGISHDEVLLLAHRMFKKYPRLCDLLLDKFQFIFVDEYQDTSLYMSQSNTMN